MGVRGLFLCAALLLAVVPARASEDAPQVTDPCGDAGGNVWYDDTAVDATPERSEGFDIEAIRFTDIIEDEEPVGVRITMALCGPVPAADFPHSLWRVNWSLDRPEDAVESCGASVYIYDGLTEAGVERAALFTKTCGQVHMVAGRAYGTSSTRFQESLPSFSVAGNTITWDLRRDEWVGEPAEILAPGTAWRRASGSSSEPGARYLWVGIGDAGVKGGANDDARGGDFVIASQTEEMSQ